MASRERFNYDLHLPDLEFAERKRRQQLRESNVEIRQLEAKLRQGYINKAVSAQIKEKEKQAEEEREEKKEDAKRFEVFRLQALEQEKLDEHREKVEKLQLQRCLRLQLKEKEQEEAKVYDHFLKEKRVIDEIVAKVKREEREKVIAAMRKKQVEQKTIQEYIEAQKVWVAREKDITDKENRDIVLFIARKDEWRKEQEALAIEKRSRKNESILNLAEELEQERKDELEKSSLLQELHEGRLRELERKMDEKEIENEIRRKVLLRESNDLAIQVKRRQKERLEADEETWKKELIAQFEKEAKLEQLSDHKRRMKRLKFKREVESLLEERRTFQRQEKLAEQEYWRIQREEEKERDAMIELERNRLLREHANKLIGFLPSGLLKEKDLEMLADEDINVLYQPRMPQDPFEQLEQYYEKLNKKKRSPLDADRPN